MEYLNVEAGKTKVESSDGHVIPCNFLEHPRFSSTCKLCAGLHYMFVRFASERTYSKGYEVRTAINSFLDYTVTYEKSNPKPLHLTDLTQISAEVFFGFDMFLKRECGPKGLATRFKTALTQVAQSFDEGMPLLMLPVLGRPESDVYEPLAEDGFEHLSLALKTHVDILYKKLEFRRVVDSIEPYSFEEITTEWRLLHCWNPDPARSLKTLISHGHPLSVEFSCFVESLRRAREQEPVQNVVELIYRRFSQLELVRSLEADSLISLGELFGLYYPTALDQVAIANLLGLQTGWNKETVMAIDGDNFQHVLTGALKSSQTLIVSEKRKSQGRGKPFLHPKAFLAPSSKDDKYSAYNLINLAKELSSPLASLQLDCTSAREIKAIRPLFLCLRPFLAMKVTTSASGAIPGRFASAANRGQWAFGSKSFFEKYEVKENGRRFTKADDLRGRLRPTWIRHVRNRSNRPLSMVAMQQGHASIETTDVHYDSSGPAVQARRDRLRIELDEVASLLRQRKFKGMLGKRGGAAPNLATLRVFNIPGQEKSLWACMNSFKPDWIGSGTRVSPGMKCSEISQCLFCSQVCIFEDSLPFLMERQSVVQNELSLYEEPPFNSPLSDELRIIEYILDEWGDEQALKSAARYWRKHPDLLPIDLRSLSILFED